MRDIKQNATNEQDKQAHRFRQQNGDFQRGKGRGRTNWVKGVIHGDGRKLNF